MRIALDELHLVLERHPNARPSVASFDHSEFRKVKRAFPDIPTFVLEHYAATDIIHSAYNMHATGIGLNKWLMNPFDVPAQPNTIA